MKLSQRRSARQLPAAAVAAVLAVAIAAAAPTVAAGPRLPEAELLAAEARAKDAEDQRLLGWRRAPYADHGCRPGQAGYELVVLIAGDNRQPRDLEVVASICRPAGSIDTVTVDDVDTTESKP